MCDYAPDAVVVLPGQVAEGHEAIRAGLEGIGSLLSGVVPMVTSLTTRVSTHFATESEQFGSDEALHSSWITA